MRRGARRIILPAGQAEEVQASARDRLFEVPRLVDALNLLETVAKPQANAPAKPGSDAPDGLQTVTN